MALRNIALVTGGNSGIGFEAVKALLESDRSYKIFMGSRSLDKAASAIQDLRKQCPQSKSTVEALQLDLASDKSIEDACEQIKARDGHIDTVVNNAGATFDIEFLKGKVSLRECFNNAYNVNVSGTNVLTWTIMPLLLKSSAPRLLFVSGLSGINKASSETYYPTPPQPAGWPKDIDFETIGYRCSKCALNMMMVDWNHKLKADGVKVWAVAPGFLATNLGGMPEKAKEMGAGHPSAGGQFLRRVVEGECDADTGKLVSSRGVLSW